MFRLGETGGIEFEYDNKKIQNLPPEIANWFTFTSDVSVQTENVPLLNGTPVNCSPILRNKLSSGTIGREIISRKPLEIFSSYDIIELLTNFLKESGISTDSQRSGIHIHITCSPGYRIFQEILNIGLYLESSLFYLGGMGKEFRGIHNNCSYSFPLSNPPYIKTGNYNRPLYIIDDIFNAKNFRDIAERMGDLINMGGIRYSPARYCYLNYFSTLLRGSLEFRVFNLTLSSFGLNLIFKLCGHITKEIIKRSFDDMERLEVNAVTDVKKDNAISIMERFLVDTRFPNVSNIITLMENTPDIYISKDPVFTHLHYHPSRGNICPSMYRGTSYFPEVYRGDIKIPSTTQSHNIRFKTKPWPLNSLLEALNLPEVEKEKLDESPREQILNNATPQRITNNYEESIERMFRLNRRGNARSNVEIDLNSEIRRTENSFSTDLPFIREISSDEEILTDDSWDELLETDEEEESF